MHFAAESPQRQLARRPAPVPRHQHHRHVHAARGRAHATASRFHHISTDEVYGDLELDDPQRFTETTPYNPSSPYSSTKAGSDLLVRAWVRSFGVQRHDLELLEQLRAVPARREVHPPPDHQRARRRAAPSSTATGENVRDWIHADDHSCGRAHDPRQGRDRRDVPDRRRRRERTTRHVVEAHPRAHGQARDAYDHVTDRPGHDLRYAIDSTKLRTELGWQPRYRRLRCRASPRPSTGTASNEAWWRPQKDATEARYREPADEGPHHRRRRSARHGSDRPLHEPRRRRCRGRPRRPRRRRPRTRCCSASERSVRTSSCMRVRGRTSTAARPILSAHISSMRSGRAMSPRVAPAATPTSSTSPPTTCSTVAAPGRTAVSRTRNGICPPRAATTDARSGAVNRKRRAFGPAATIARTSWVCGPHGHNFVKTMLRVAANGETTPVTVVDDQRGRPTFTADLAAALDASRSAGFQARSTSRTPLSSRGSALPERSSRRAGTARNASLPSHRTSCCQPARRRARVLRPQ